MTDPEKIAKLKAGQRLRFPARTPGTESAELRLARTVEAAWVMELLTDGVIHVPIAIENSIIRGALKLTTATLRFDCSITGSEFEDEVHLDFVQFLAGLDLTGSTLDKGMTLRGARVANDVMIEGCRFAKASLFQDVQINQALNAKGAVFHRVNFERTEILKNAFFNYSQLSETSTQFRGEADFKQVWIHGAAEFDGAQFYSNANFDGGHFGRLFLRPDANDPKGRPPRFAKAVSFISALFDDTTLIVGVLFADEAVFDNAQFESLYLEPAITARGTVTRVRFRRDAVFLGARVSGRAQFVGVSFHKHANFDQMSVRGLAYFRAWPYQKGTEEHVVPITFHRATFTAAHFHGLVQFWGAQFDQQADFRYTVIDGPALFGADKRKLVPPASFRGAADFTNSRFNSTLEFVGVTFRKEVTFERAICGADTSFEAATFHDKVTLRQAQFKFLSFGVGASEATFYRTGAIDLRGMQYEQITGSWQTILHYMSPYDRQQYDLLEAMTRRAGEDTEADNIYYARRTYETRLFWEKRRIAKAGLHAFHWLLAGYGVRLRRLATFTFLIILVGTLVFRQPRATRAAAPYLEPAPEIINYAAALGLSFRQFMPLDMPSGKTLEPTTNPMPVIGISFSAYATLQRLTGLVLVPLWVAAITTHLRRKRNTV